MNKSNKLPEQVKVRVFDNRDFNTTWLWINDTQYIEIDPEWLYYMAVENDPENTDFLGHELE